MYEIQELLVNFNEICTEFVDICRDHELSVAIKKKGKSLQFTSANRLPINLTFQKRHTISFPRN